MSRTLVQNDAVSLTLFAFDKDEEIGIYDSKGDTTVFVLEGVGEFTVDGMNYEVHVGESFIMPVSKTTFRVCKEIIQIPSCCYFCER